MTGQPLSAGITFGLGMISAQHDSRDPRTDAGIYADLLDLVGDVHHLAALAGFEDEIFGVAFHNGSDD